MFFTGGLICLCAGMHACACSKASQVKSEGDAFGKFQGENCPIERGQHPWAFLVSRICEPESIFPYEEEMEGKCGAPGALYQ